ncbi:hypothetical protein SAMN02745857_03448 [Andreprevotia lacus DSM 23236]|jgi:hypothetical protein|uniref:Uncharacterized protein n=1 Tax=Andreprevotia lacus DSM 23236 TaxID=1121001 RepID=A0A1W1XY81_9NEIS|nr:hypothetical protein SAMN02745857_03448 [Andreprevotia lacus DSM 23236]
MHDHFNWVNRRGHHAGAFELYLMEGWNEPAQLRKHGGWCEMFCRGAMVSTRTWYTEWHTDF